MTYQEAESFLLGREMFGWKLGLERMERFLAGLGAPQEQFDTVHVAGTNGKGSVTAMMGSVLKESGHRCGIYTSPHLESLRERIRVDGLCIAEEAVVGLVERWRPLIEELQCTFFETMTGLALRHFADAGVQSAVIEVGLGGRLDATNVLHPLVSIITSISYDHMDHLGDTIAAIAAEKAGIIKPAVPCVIGSLPVEAEEVIRARAADLDSPLYAADALVEVRHLRLTESGSEFSAQTEGARYEGLSLPLPGPHQVANSCIAICASELLGRQGVIPFPPPLKRALAGVDWPGRFEIFLKEPRVITDVAHNPGGFQQQKWMWRHFYPDWQKVLVLGLVKEKDLKGVIGELPRDVAQIYVVPAPTHRALPVAELTGALAEAGLPVVPCGSVQEGVRAAITWARGGTRRVVCITGSHYVVGESLRGIKDLTK
ncbi:MAG TPA: folylpolyglutamate synthase/dihydrofolate synthase family protein [bacterium]|nr:folylpolyglutamate synthase/dihydrofolate synthase family protein [bacterium]